MKPKDIKREHTRKEMNSLSEKLGIEDPTSYPNKTELAEKMIDSIESGESEENLSETISDIRSILKEARDTEVIITDFKNDIKEINEAKKEGELLKAAEMIDPVIEKGENILFLGERIKEMNELLDEMYEGEKKEELVDRVYELYDKCDEGKYKEALEESDGLLDEIKKEVDEEKDFEDKVKESINKAKEKLSELRKTKIKIDHVKDEIRGAVQAYKEGDLEESLEKVERALEDSEIMLEIAEKLEEGRSRIEVFEEKGLEIESYVDKLKNGEKKVNNREYNHALELLDDVLDQMEGEMEDIKEEEKEIEEIKGEEEKEIEDKDIPEKKVKDIHRKIEAIEKAIKFVKKDLEDLHE